MKRNASSQRAVETESNYGGKKRKRQPAPITGTQVGQKSALVAIVPQEIYKKYKILI